MGLDATKPLSAEPMTFTRIRVADEEAVDLDVVVQGMGGDWRKVQHEYRRQTNRDHLEIRLTALEKEPSNAPYPDGPVPSLPPVGPPCSFWRKMRSIRQGTTLSMP